MKSWIWSRPSFNCTCNCQSSSSFFASATSKSATFAINVALLAPRVTVSFLLELIQLLANVHGFAVAKELTSSFGDILQLGVLPLQLVHLFPDPPKRIVFEIKGGYCNCPPVRYLDWCLSIDCPVGGLLLRSRGHYL